MKPHQYQCAMCRCVFDERVVTMWNKVIGWEKRRDQGGTNHIAARGPQSEYRCDVCMSRVLAGDDAGQGVMFAR